MLFYFFIIHFLNLCKLQNLFNSKCEYPINGILSKTENPNWGFAIVRLCDTTTGYFWSSHIAMNLPENWVVRYVGAGPLQRIAIYLNEEVVTLRYESTPEERTQIDSVTYFYFN